MGGMFLDDQGDARSALLSHDVVTFQIFALRDDRQEILEEGKSHVAKKIVSRCTDARFVCVCVYFIPPTMCYQQSSGLKYRGSHVDYQGTCTMIDSLPLIHTRRKIKRNIQSLSSGAFMDWAKQVTAMRWSVYPYSAILLVCLQCVRSMNRLCMINNSRSIAHNEIELCLQSRNWRQYAVHASVRCCLNVRVTSGSMSVLICR